jgi:AmmeMemoRadiSam system protein B
MHLPYIQAVMGSRPYQLVPVLVGSLAPADAERYGKALAPYLADPQSVFVVSSDFCHWGARFSYQPVDERYAQVSAPAGRARPSRPLARLSRRPLPHLS